MPLQDLIKSIEQSVGTFSKYTTTSGPGEAIPYAQKPAQQFLSGLGVSNAGEPLSVHPKGALNHSEQPDLEVLNFTSDTATKLTIDGARVQRLLKSAKTYINTSIVPEGTFVPTLGKHQPQEQTQESTSGKHWQNLAVGIVHVQEIDLLVTQAIQPNGEAYATPKTGHIDADAPSILLLSSPALNFAYGQAGALTKNEATSYLENMYRNLFDATLKEGRNNIAMPAAGLGVFGGNPEQYFSILMKVAQEYPQLNIIYHPAQFGAQFEQALKTANHPGNVARATKDVVFLADELNKNGHPCALHNPSDADAVFGVYDIGEYWKTGTGSGYVGEEHIGAMSTAPLNSLSLNPNAYTKVVERALDPTPKLEKISDDPSAKMKTSPVPQQSASNSSFYLNCLTGILAVTGGALLVVGILLNPALTAYGIGVSVAAAATGLYGLFANRKPAPKENEDLSHTHGVDLN